MSLRPEVLTVVFGQGVDTKTDPKLVVPGKLTKLENGLFGGGTIRKKNGYSLLAAKALDESAVPSGDALATFQDELLLYGNQKVYSYSESTGRFIDKGDAVSCVVQTDDIIRNTAKQTCADMAVLNGVSIYAWEDSRGGVRASVFDETTGTLMLSDVSLDASASRPKCLSFGSHLFCFYYISGEIKARRINPISPTAFESAVTITSTINTSNPNYDVVLLNPTRAVLAWNVQGSAQVKACLIDENASVAVSEIAVASQAGTSAVSVVVSNLSKIHVCYHNTTDGLRCTIRNNALSEIAAAFTVENYTSTAIPQITGYKLGDGSGVKWFYEIYQTDTYKHYVKTNTTTDAGVAGSASVLVRGVGLASKAWSYYGEDDTNTKGYVTVTHESTLQSTYFVIRQDGLVVAKMKYGLGGGLRARDSSLSNVCSETSGVYKLAILSKGELRVDSGVLFALTGISRTTIDFTNENVFNTAELAKNLHIVGGVLSMYDGQAVVEHGFHLFPENLSASVSGAAGVANGNYNYVAVYEWTDNFGQVHRSAPSAPLSFEVTGGPRNVAVVVPTLRLTAKKSSRSNISIALYRTEEGPGEIYYRASSITSPTYNDVTADTVTITDTTADTALISNEVLYTTGGIIENISPPACSSISVFKNRIVLTGLEEKNKLWYSKEILEGQAVEFSDLFVKTIEAEGGRETGAAVIDDQLMIYKRTIPFVMVGDGFDRLGQGQDFAIGRVNVDIGCTNGNAITRAPDGLFLKTVKGIYSQDGSLGVSYVGDGVEAFNATTVVAGTLKSDVNQVRFLTSDGPCLVYDYYYKQWSTFTNDKGKDAVIWRDQYVYLRSDGKLVVEDPETFKDLSSSASLRLETGWISAAGLQGVQRIRRFGILGEYKSPHKLRVRVAYDYSPAYTDHFIFSPDTALDVNTYGEDATYGDAVYGGTEDGTYRFRASLSRQKCTAIRFLIEDIVTSATEGSQEAFSITSLALEVGIKPGINRLKSAQTLGAS
jgi:hypothetical protein